MSSQLPSEVIKSLVIYLQNNPKAHYFSGSILEEEIWTRKYYKLQQLAPNNFSLVRLGLPLTHIKSGFETGQFSFLYLIRSAKNAEDRNPIYKIGKTEQSPELRMKEYRNGTEIFDLREVRKLTMSENRLIKQFNSKFKKTEGSREWYRGDVRKMRREFFDFCEKLDGVSVPLTGTNIIVPNPNRFTENVKLFLSGRKITNLTQDYLHNLFRRYRCWSEKNYKEPASKLVFEITVKEYFRNST